MNKIIEPVSISEDMKSLLSNALRHQMNTKKNIDKDTLYKMSFQFSINESNVVSFDEVGMTKVQEIPVETSMKEKYDEYDILMKVSKQNAPINKHVSNLKAALFKKKPDPKPSNEISS